MGEREREEERVREGQKIYKGRVWRKIELR